MILESRVESSKPLQSYKIAFRIPQNLKNDHEENDVNDTLLILYQLPIGRQNVEPKEDWFSIEYPI
jgi:hypothetical protein